MCDEGGEARRVEWVPENGGVEAVEVQEKDVLRPERAQIRRSHCLREGPV